MIKLDYKMINEENGISMEFDNEYEYNEFLDDCLNIDYNELSGDLLRSSYRNIEVLVVSINDNVVFDYMR